MEPGPIRRFVDAEYETWRHVVLGEKGRAYNMWWWARDSMVKVWILRGTARDPNEKFLEMVTR